MRTRCALRTRSERSESEPRRPLRLSQRWRREAAGSKLPEEAVCAEDLTTQLREISKDLTKWEHPAFTDRET